MAPEPSQYSFLDFNAPLSGARADALAAALARSEPRRVIDIGCGWGELLLRVVGAAQGATGVGIDQDGALIERARRNAANRGLADRVEFVEGPAPVDCDPVDLVLCVGSDHAYGDQSQALLMLHRLVAPGGRLLFGSGFWDAQPTDEQAQTIGLTPDSLSDLNGLVELAIDVGFRPLFVQTANRDEWEFFESSYLADWEEWLHRHGDDPTAPEVRSLADRHRKGWLAGYRDVLGFAYLTLSR